MATTEDTGLVDRRSLRELQETGVGGKRAPLSAKKQLANTKEFRRREKVENSRLRQAQSTDSNQ